MIFLCVFVSAQPRLSRAEERHHFHAPPSMRTAVRKLPALKMIHTLLEDRGASHIVSLVPHRQTRTVRVWAFILSPDLISFNHSF